MISTSPILVVSLEERHKCLCCESVLFSEIAKGLCMVTIKKACFPWFCGSGLIHWLSAP